jgi:hypothetical protein
VTALPGAESVRLIERKLYGANPNFVPQVKAVFEKENIKLCEPKPLTLKQRVRNLLIKIFKGHEEFLGCTPD